MLQDPFLLTDTALVSIFPFFLLNVKDLFA